MNNYNAVKPRLSLKKKEANTVPAQHKTKNLKDPANWPKTLHDFISACFAKSAELKLNAGDKKKFQTELKELVNIAIEGDKVGTNDWRQQTLPSLNPSQSDMQLKLHCDILEANRLLQLEKKKHQFELERQSKQAINPNIKSKNVFGEDSDSESDSYEPFEPTNISKTKLKQQTDNKRSLGLSFNLPPLKKSKMPSSVVPASLPQKTDSKNLLVEYNGNANDDALSQKERIRLRAQRFERELSNSPVATPINEQSQDLDKPLIGTCKILEKKYLRLTSQPNPASVRPLPILKKTLQLLVTKYLDGASYNYLCDQFKSMRQDLTVQHIKNQFTVQVYEYHCKLAIQFQDLGEFNQCQSQLKLLYENGEFPYKLEFYSYRILYYVITKNFDDAFDLKLKLMKEGVNIEEDEFLQNALNIVQYIVLNDFYQLFKLVKQIKLRDSQDTLELQPLTDINIATNKDSIRLNHSKRFFFLKLLQPIIVKERMKALAIICKSYRKISLDFIKEGLLLDSGNDMESFLDEYKLNEFVTGESSLKFFDCHRSKFAIDSLREQMYKKIDIKGQI